MEQGGTSQWAHTAGRDRLEMVNNRSPCGSLGQSTSFADRHSPVREYTFTESRKKTRLHVRREIEACLPNAITLSRLSLKATCQCEKQSERLCHDLPLNIALQKGRGRENKREREACTAQREEALVFVPSSVTDDLCCERRWHSQPLGPSISPAIKWGSQTKWAMGLITSPTSYTL
jgi:hypothetical protein